MKNFPLPEYKSEIARYRWLTDMKELTGAIRMGGSIVAIDTETYYNPDVGGVIRVINDAKNNAPFCLTATVKVDDEYISYYVPEEMIPECKSFIEDASITKLLQNFHYDAHILRNLGIEIKGFIWDTMIMIHLIDEEHVCNTPDGGTVKSKSLKNMAYHYLGDDGHFFEDLVTEVRSVLAKNRECAKSMISYKDAADASPDAMKDYACSDTEFTYKLWEKFMPMLEAQNLGGAYDIDYKATLAVIEIERVGVKVDSVYYQKLFDDLGEEIAAIDQEMFAMGVDKGLNINSADDLVKMFELFGVTWVWFTNKGAAQTTDSVLSNFKEGKPAELAQYVLKRRECSKLRDTFVAQMLRFTQDDGRVHCDFNVCPRDDSAGGTVTGRLSSSNPNFQNIPKDDKRIRKGVVPEEGHVLFACDYDQQEYRLLGVYADDRSFNEIIRSGQDIHTGTAALMFNLPYEVAAEKKHRKVGKTLNFALVYGTGKAHLAQMLGYDIDAALYNRAGFLLRDLGYKPWQKYPYVDDIIATHKVTDVYDIEALRYFFSEAPKASLESAQKMKDAYFAQFPSIQGFIKDCNGRAKTRGFALMWDGRRRHFKDAKAEAYKATNACIQGGCGSITKQKLWDCLQFLKDYESRMINVIHDDITFEIKKNELHIIPELMKIMETTEFPLPFTVSAEISSTNWGEMEDWDGDITRQW